jgi:predicted transcriptional regulator
MTDIGKKPKRNTLLIRLDDDERRKLEQLAATWGVPLAAAIRRLIREAKPAR